MGNIILEPTFLPRPRLTFAQKAITLEGWFQKQEFLWSEIVFSKIVFKNDGGRSCYVLLKTKSDTMRFQKTGYRDGRIIEKELKKHLRLRVSQVSFNWWSLCYFIPVGFYFVKWMKTGHEALAVFLLGSMFLFSDFFFKRKYLVKDGW